MSVERQPCMSDQRLLGPTAPAFATQGLVHPSSSDRLTGTLSLNHGIECLHVDRTAAAAFKQGTLFDGEGHVVHVSFDMG